MKKEEQKKNKLTTKSEAHENNKELFELYIKGGRKDIKLRNEIVIKNQALISYILTKYFPSGPTSHTFGYGYISEDLRKELFQEGTLGLLAAIEGYNPALGYKFSTYSGWWLRQAINNYLTNINPIIKIPSHIRAAQSKLFKELKLQKKDVASILFFNEDEYNQNYDYDTDENNKTSKKTGGTNDNNGKKKKSKKKERKYGVTEKMLSSIGSALKSKQIISLSAPSVSPGADPSDGNYCLEDILFKTEQGAIHLGGSSGGGRVGTAGSGRTAIGGESSSSSSSVFHKMDKEQLTAIVGGVLENMSEKKKMILLLRYGILEEKDLIGKKAQA